MEYQLDKWKRQDWRKQTCHYSCEVRQNLFGQWVVLRRWGRLSATQGQSLEEICDCYEDGEWKKTGETLKPRSLALTYRSSSLSH